jgi:proteasome assembly chaperone (PAC2) family protein
MDRITPNPSESNRGGRGVKTRFHWIVGQGLPEHSAILEAVPGVGNVGKLVVDALVEKHPSRTIGWILHPDFPPHATLSKDGLMAPPRLDINSVILPDGKTIITIGGNLQPMTANGQFEVADSILELAKKYNTPQLLVLAGLAAGAEDRSIYVICADSEVKKSLEKNDITVTNEQPTSGMIGMAGLLISLSPLHDVRAIGLVAETIGASADVLAADRLASWIEEGLELPLNLDLDTTEKTAEKLLATMEVSGSINDILENGENQNDSNFYA